MKKKIYSCALLLLFAFAGGKHDADERNSSKMKNGTQTILAIGAHAGDMEISCGAVLAKQAMMGDRVVILHLTLGEGGNPKMSAEDYGSQKKREALKVDSLLGAEPIFGPYHDGELPNDEVARHYVANVIRMVKPSCIITHWTKSIHKDHSNAHAVVVDAILLASLPSVGTVTPYSETEYPEWRGVKRILYTENWEDMDDYQPYVYVDVNESLEKWEKAVKEYEFIGGKISSFPYLNYYKSLASVRGAEAGFACAVSFNVDQFDKKLIWKTINP
ncbi:MAG TPA: PIG-L family deacetylase [Candidatus Kryptonia bacterium]